MADLKPCPFCGGPNIAFHQDHGVECDDCGASARDDLIWNKRAEPADSILVPIEPPLSLLPHLTNYARVDHMDDRDRAAILGRLRSRWLAIVEALRPYGVSEVDQQVKHHQPLMPSKEEQK